MLVKLLHVWRFGEYVRVLVFRRHQVMLHVNVFGPRLACLFTASLMAPFLSPNPSTSLILIDGSMKPYTFLKNRTSFTASDEVT